jgi:hypothetical protein
MTETITLEPHWPGMRAYVKHVARTDPETARLIGESMGREAFERITAADIEPGDVIAQVRDRERASKVEAIESVGQSSLYIRLEGNERIRPRHTAKFWRLIV